MINKDLSDIIKGLKISPHWFNLILFIGYTPIPRPNYKPPPPNGCGSPVFGFQVRKENIYIVINMCNMYHFYYCNSALNFSEVRG